MTSSALLISEPCAVTFSTFSALGLITNSDFVVQSANRLGGAVKNLKKIGAETAIKAGQVRARGHLSADLSLWTGSGSGHERHPLHQTADLTISAIPRWRPR